MLIFLLSTWFSLLFDQQRCLFWLQCLGNIHLNSKCVFFRSFREWYVCLIHWQGAGLLKSVSALCPCCLGPSSTVWLRVADTFMALCDIFFPLLISSPFPVPRPLVPCSRDSLAMSLKVLLAVESAVPEAGEGKWRCLSTQTLLPAFPTSSFPKQTGGFSSSQPWPKYIRICCVFFTRRGASIPQSSGGRTKLCVGGTG